jgi:hypothetical protein
MMSMAPTDDLLELGLAGLASAPTVFPGLWFHGHHGAAVLSAHFIRSTFSIPREVDDAVEAFAYRIVESVPQVFARNVSGSTCVSFTPLVTKLEKTITTLTADGHDVIFASLALKALDARPDLATAEVVGGLVQLIDDAQNDNPKRYFGYEDYINESVDYSDVPVFRSARQAATHALYLHDTVYPDQALDGHHYFLAGNKLHDLTHAHALAELEDLGYRDIAELGLESLRKQFHLCDVARVPDGVTPYDGKGLLNPYSLEFWQRDKSDVHQIKLAYSIMSLLQHVPEEEHDSILRSVTKYWQLLP